MFVLPLLNKLMQVLEPKLELNLSSDANLPWELVP